MENNTANPTPSNRYCRASTTNNGAVSTVTIIVDGLSAAEFRKSIDVNATIGLMQDAIDALKMGDGMGAMNLASEAFARQALFLLKG